MPATVNIASLFPKHLFWDMDYDKLRLHEDKDIIIPRALFATTKESFPEDIQRLERFYPPSQIVDVLQQIKERISNKVCRWVARRYNVEPFARF